MGKIKVLFLCWNIHQNVNLQQIKLEVHQALLSLEKKVVDDFIGSQASSLLCHVQLNLGSLPDCHWLPGHGVAQAHHSSNEAESTGGDGSSTDEGIFDHGRHLQKKILILSDEVICRVVSRRPKRDCAVSQFRAVRQIKLF